MMKKSALFMTAALLATAAPAAEPPKLAEAIRKVPAGKWTQLEKVGFGGRVHSKVVLAPEVNALVYWGTRSHGKPFRTYDTEFFDLATAKWTDAIPPGKEAELKGNYKNWPGWNMGGSTYFYDYKGLKRPRPTIVYNMAAWDAGRKRAVYYCGITFAYDPAKRAWTELKPRTAPPPGLYGSAMCYDAANKQIVLFGGFGAEAPEGRPGTWYFDCEKDEWERPQFGPEVMQSGRDAFRKLGIRARTLRRDAQYLLGLTGEERKKASTGLDKDIKKLVSQLDAALVPRPGPPLPPPYGPALSAGLKLVHQARGSVAKASSSGGIAAVAALEAAEDLLYYRAVDALRTQPPPRCNSPLVYDPKNKAVVLFGGDHLDFKLADTWVLDAKKNRWTRRKPPTSPPPQDLHAMCYLPKSGLVLLASPLGNWTYDAAKDQWKPVAGTGPGVNRNTGLSMAALPGTDTVVGVQASRYRQRATWVYKLDPAAGPAKHKPGKPPLTAPLPKAHKHSRKWYDDLPAPDPNAFAAKIKALPENVWTPLSGEKEIRARTWSSCTYDSKRRELIYWGGGHSGNVNSNVDHFSMRTGRWSRNLDSTWKPSPFGAMAACPKGRTYYDEPWTMHARKTYAYDPVSGTVVMAYVGGGGYYHLRGGKKGRHTWIYDPRTGGWPLRIDTPFKCGYNGAAVSTPKGVVLLDGGQAWLLSVKDRKWSKVGEAAKLPFGEYYTMVYDSKRNRLVYLAADRKRAGKRWQYTPAMHIFPLDTGAWEKASPQGAGCASRDAVYVPSQDAVLAHTGSGQFKVYLCADNKWISGPAGTFKGTRKGISEHAVTMDPATETVLWIDANGFCGPFTLKALKLNVGKLKK